MLSLIVSALPRPPVVCVHCEFVGGFGTESVDVGGQSVEAVVLEGFVTAVGVVGTDGVARCVVVVAGGMAQRIGDGFGQPLGVVAVACSVTGGVGDADEVAASVVGVGGNPARGIVDGNRQKEGVLRPSENRKNRWRALRHAPYL